MPNSKFGERLRKQRQILKLSQEALGVKIGLDESCSRSRISRYETGTHEPDGLIAKRLAEALQVPLEYLYCERETAAKLTLVAYYLSDEQIESLISDLVVKYRIQRFEKLV